MTAHIKPNGEPIRAFANRVLAWNAQDELDAKEREWRSIDESPVVGLFEGESITRQQRQQKRITLLQGLHFVLR